MKIQIDTIRTDNGSRIRTIKVTVYPFDLEHFLEKGRNGELDNFMPYFNEKNLKKMSPKDWIHSMTWRYTKQGHEYWSRVNQGWLQYLENSLGSLDGTEIISWRVG